MASSAALLSTPSTWYLPPAMNRPSANSRVSPGRNGKNSPHSTKTITRLTQMKAPPNSLEQPLGVEPLDPEQHGLHERCQVREQRHGAMLPGEPARRLTTGCLSTVGSVGRDRDDAEQDAEQDADLPDERAPYDPMPHGPRRGRRRPVGGAVADRRAVRRAAARRGRPPQRRGPLPLLDARGDRGRPRPAPPRLPRGHRELAARLQHRDDRALGQRLPGPRGAHRRQPALEPARGDGDRPLPARPPPPGRRRAGRAPARAAGRPGARCWGIDNLPGSLHLETTRGAAPGLLPVRPGGAGALRAGPRGRATRRSRSRSSARPGRSTPRPRPRSRCTPGSAPTPTSRATTPGAARQLREPAASAPPGLRHGLSAAGAPGTRQDVLERREAPRGVALDRPLGDAELGRRLRHRQPEPVPQQHRRRCMAGSAWRASKSASRSSTGRARRPRARGRPPVPAVPGATGAGVSSMLARTMMVRA